MITFYKWCVAILLLSSFFTSALVSAADNSKEITALIKQLGTDPARDAEIRTRLRTLLPTSAADANHRIPSPHGVASGHVANSGDSYEGYLHTEIVDKVDKHGRMQCETHHYLRTGTEQLQVVFLNGSTGIAQNGTHVRIGSGYKAAGRILSQHEPIVLSSPNASASSASTPACSTTGPQRGLVIAVNFRDDTRQPVTTATLHTRHFGATQSLADYWNVTSAGQTTLSGDTLGWYTLDMDSRDACDDTHRVKSLALQQAAADTDLTQYNRIFFIMQNPAGCNWIGTATLGCSSELTPDGPVSASMYWAVAGRYSNARTALALSAHEGGHNLGLGHAAVRDYGIESIGPPDNLSGSHVEVYGNRFDVMGKNTSHYSAPWQYQIGWLSDAQVVKISTSGTHLLEPLSVAPTSTGIRALRVFRATTTTMDVDKLPALREYLWLETRAAAGYDNNLPTQGHGGIIIHHKHRWSFSQTENLDMHPGSDNGIADYDDTPLASGESFTDAHTGMVISHLGIDAAGRVAVNVYYDPARADTDEDGLTDVDETAYGTNLNHADGDGDRITDFFEVCYSTIMSGATGCDAYEPGTADLNANSADTDADGLADYLEIQTWRTGPLNSDHDGDGLSDGEEINIHLTLPAKSDSDGDGLSDGDEVRLYGSNPLSNLDTDIDGMPDDWETARGTDPLIEDARLDLDGDGVINVVESLRASLPNVATSIPVPALKTVYVNAATGNDSNADGSTAFPYRTLNAAINATTTTHGDTVEVAPGHYDVGSLYFDKSLRLLGPADRSAIIAGTSFNWYLARWGTMSGFDIRVSDHRLSGTLNVVYTNCRLASAWVSHYDYGGPRSPSKVELKHCVVTNPNTLEVGLGLGPAPQDPGSLLPDQSTLSLINTVIVGFPVGVRQTGPDTHLMARNSIFDNDVNLQNVDDTSDIRYSLFKDGFGNGGVFAGTGNINAVPLFIDPINGDFRLQSTSPGMDAGDPADAHDLEPEPNGCRVNMGAYGNTVFAELSLDVDGDGNFGACVGDPPPPPPPPPPVVECENRVVTILGSADADTIIGTPDNDVIAGLGGNDIIYAGAGDDVICAGEGYDTVYGEDGDDIAYGEKGNDALHGGNGADTLHGHYGYDTLYGDAGDDTLMGMHGNDTLDGGEGVDTCDGGPNTDLGFACENSIAFP